MLAICLALSLVGCAAPAATSIPSPSAAETPSVVTLADPVLEAMVRTTMGKPEGGITVAEAEAVTRLSLSTEWQRYISQEPPIKDIDGLESFTNLESLDLSFHAITDITPLAGLKKLTSLSLSNNPVADISPLAGLTGLKVLILTGCKAQDYAPLAKLANLDFLMLDNATIADVSPLASLTKLKHLYLTGSPINNYFPLSDIYQNLEQKDFTIAFTLAELGFTFNDGDKMALYQTDKYDIRINHAEWGAPPQPDWQNCIRVVTGAESGYKNCVGFYPEHNAYVVWMFNPQTQKDYTYVYDVTTKSFNCDRASMEAIVQVAFGDVTATDVLLAPVQFFDNLLMEALGITVDTLCSMPFEQTAAQPAQTTAIYAPPYEQLGFTADTANAVCIYERQEPHYMRIAIHRPEWGENPDGWNAEFYDDDMNGSKLHILYYETEGKYHVSIEKDGVEASFETYPATGKKGWEYPNLDTAHRVFNAAFGTQGKELYDRAPAYFEQVVQELFGMSVDELYALPVGK